MEFILIINKVTKKDGTTQAFNAEKINKWSEWACSGTSAKWSPVINRAMKKMHEGVSTSEIQRALRSSCSELVPINVDYDKVAAKLLLADIRKPIFSKSMSPPSFKSFHEGMVRMGLYSPHSLSDSEINLIEAAIDHSRDTLFSHGGLKQIISKFLIKRDDATLETPQFFYMSMAVDGFSGEPIEDILGLYDLLSLHKVNVPTPVQLGLRTKSRGFASCNVVRAKDTLNSIGAAQDIIYTMTANRAGVGAELNIRTSGDNVRDGEVQHYGKLNYYKLILANVNANSQQCYSEDTMLLTSDGFLPFSKIKKKHRVGQVDAHGNVVFVTPTNIFKYDNEDTIMHLYSSDRMSLLVTDNHRMSYLPEGSQDLTEIESSELDLSSGGSFISSGGYNDSARGPTTLSYHEKVVLYSHMLGAKTSDGFIEVTLPNKSFLPYFKSLCSMSGVAYKSYDLKVLIHDEFIYDNVDSLGCFKLSSVSFDWCVELIGHLREWYPVLSNGDCHCSLNSELATNVVSSIASLCSTPFSESDDGLIILFSDPDRIKIPFSEVTKRDILYTGKTYCVEVPTGRVIVKRNGHSVVSGNSRGGSATVQFNVFDPEIESLIRLKSQRVSEERRIDKLDYSLAVNDFFIRRMLARKDITLFSIKDCPELYELFFSKNLNKFIKEYERCEEYGLGKGVVRGDTLLSDYMKQRLDTGRMYIHRVDESNRRSMYKDPIISSNLCVAPETMLLTREGYIAIHQLKDKEVDVWNGEVYSTVVVKRTSSQAEIHKVTMSNGTTLSCTPGHKWHIQDSNGSPIEMTTDDLVVGDAIEGFVVPITNGSTRIDVRALGERAFEPSMEIMPQFASWDYGSKVQFLKGVISGYGIQGKSVITICCSHEPGLRLFSLVLSTMGIRVQNLVNTRDGCCVSFKLEQYEACIAGQPQPLIYNFLTIVDIDRTPKFSQTYCFTEPLKHKAVFNGIYTGQCLEILEPTEGYDSAKQLYENKGTGFVRYLTSSGREVVSGLSDQIGPAVTGYDITKGSSLHGGGETVTEVLEYKQDAEVALCNLGAIACGRVSDEDYGRSAYLLLKLVDNIISIQDYPYEAMKFTSIRRRNAGIGLINIAHALADNGFKYDSQEGRNFVHRETEKFSYHLHRASVLLAKERGRCEWFNRTRYADGVLPMDLCPEAVSHIHTQDLLFDWDSLRADIVKHGMRNSILEAGMPSETSSVTINATNSCEPIRSLIVHKSSNTGSTTFIAPDYERLKDKYDLAFDLDQKEYAKVIAIMQKFFGQSISYNEYYDYNKYPNGVIPIITVIENFLHAAKLGVKTWYYLNTEVSNGGAASQGCSSGGCTV